jgi:filamentous hemagglutinin family protein
MHTYPGRREGGIPVTSSHPAHLLPFALLRPLLTCGVLLCSGLLAVSQAQITLDGSLGPRRPLSGPHYTIPAVVGQIRGPNLFHSFGEFTIHTGESATFTGSSSIANILGRVTGGQQSVIDGLLRSAIPGGNLFLLNPSGVLFGPNASLDVSGSFHISTADYLRLADGGTFAANLAENSVLTVAPPAAFGFLREKPAGIAVQGSTLQVPADQTVSVVGGKIEVVRGSLSAPSGQVHIASVASAGEVVPRAAEQVPGLTVDSFARLGEITLSNFALVDASGNGGGTVVIRGGRLLVDQSFIFADTIGDVQSAPTGIDMQVAEEVILTNGALLTTDVLGAGGAGTIQVTANRVAVSNGAVLGSRAFFGSSGDAGDITLEVGTLEVTEGAQIDSGTVGTGQGGVVTVTATEAVTIAGDESGLFSNTFGRGAAGSVTVTTPNLTMEGGLIQTRGGEGAAGTIEVQAAQVTLTAGAQIDSRTDGMGQGGTVRVTVADSMILAGRGSNDALSGLFSNTFGAGQAGVIEVRAGQLMVREGGQIVSSAQSGSSGDAGQVTIEVDRLEVTEGGQIGSATFGTGQGGVVTVTATEAVTIAGDESGLFTNAAGSRRGGKYPPPVSPHAAHRWRCDFGGKYRGRQCREYHHYGQ